jgi:hypothetical protein
MKTKCFWFCAFVLVPVVLFVLPRELHSDPRLYLPVFAADAVGLVWLAYAYRRHRRELAARLNEMERSSGPGIYHDLLAAYREGRRRKRNGN